MTDTPVTRLRELHRRCSCWGENCGGVRPNVDANSHCAKCIVTYPCDTIAALDALDALLVVSPADLEAFALSTQSIIRHAEGKDTEIRALQARIDAAAMSDKYTITDMREHGVGWVDEQSFADLLDLIEQMQDALYSALNLEGPAQYAARTLDHFKGLDVLWHGDKIRTVLNHPLLGDDHLSSDEQRGTTMQITVTKVSNGYVVSESGLSVSEPITFVANNEDEMMLAVRDIFVLIEKRPRNDAG